MAKKLNSMPDFTAHLPKSVHDLSQSTAYTCCPGSLNPVYFDMLHTGDKLHFSASEFVRLNPLNGQPLGEIDVHLDYFFVPLSVMYTPAPSMFYQTDDLVSSALLKTSFPDTTKFPVFDLKGSFGPVFADATVPNNACVYATIDGNPRTLNNQAFDCLGKSLFRMFDFFDIPVEPFLDHMGHLEDESGRTAIDDLPSFTPWFALAYQAVYQLYFRNDDREPKNYHYNIDKYYNSVSFNENTAVAKSIFSLNYCSRPKDYFNSVKVSPILSTISSLNPTALKTVFGTVNEWLSNSAVRGVSPDASAVSSVQDATQVKAYTVGSSGSSQFTLGAIRSMYMVEKLLRVIGRSEKNYESQFLAHFGVKIPHDSMHSITHIGHDMVTLRPDSVISSANTYNAETDQGSALGEIGGKGAVMLTGRKHNFEAPFHGVFLCISHIIPRRRYVLGLNKLHQLNSITDFYQPEFDKKGMQPIFSYEALFDSSLVQSHDMSRRLGWQFAYEQFKRKSDRVTRAFQPTRERSNVNTLAPWVIANLPYGYLNFNGIADTSIIHIEPHTLMVCPTDMNACMVVPYNPFWPSSVASTVDSRHHKPWLVYQSDPFIVDFNMYCKKVNGMSEYGEPEL